MAVNVKGGDQETLSATENRWPLLRPSMQVEVPGPPGFYLS
jgi:hypothetical protein